jgi:hypothetical protein
MKAMILAIGVGVGLLAAGCVNTVTDQSTAGMPFVRDKMEGRYERPVGQVFQAAKDVIKDDGVLVREGTIYSTNEVKYLEGKVNQRNVWVRVEALDPKVTSVIVQARTAAGGSDLYLAAQLDKEIALRLK